MKKELLSEYREAARRGAIPQRLLEKIEDFNAAAAEHNIKVRKTGKGQHEAMISDKVLDSIRAKAQKKARAGGGLLGYTTKFQPRGASS